MTQTLEFHSINKPYPGEPRSGDLVFKKVINDILVLGIIDVLGHGAKAADFAEVINNFFNNKNKSDVNELIFELDQEVSPSLGAAVGLASIELKTGELEYVSVGNTSAYLLGKVRKRSFVSRDGIVGQNMRTPLLQKDTLEINEKIVMTSDGISGRFYTEFEESLLSQSPRDLCETIMIKNRKEYDDASCLVYELNEWNS